MTGQVLSLELLNRLTCSPKMARTMKLQRKSLRKSNGFTLLELVVVIAILSILAGIAVPSYLGFLKSSKIDQAKTILNSAIADCLQQAKENQATSIAPSTQSLGTLESLGYKVEAGKSSCSDYSIIPSDPGENYLFPMSFSVDMDGNVSKFATPANDKGSYQSCVGWAGTACSASSAQKEAWAKQKAIQDAKALCDKSLSEWLGSQKTFQGGSFKMWDVSTNSCTLQAWGFEGSLVKDEASYKQALADKVGILCTSKYKEQENKGYTGLYSDPQCPPTYFVAGKNIGTDELSYQAALVAQQKQVCDVAYNSWLISAATGQFIKQGCESKWKCIDPKGAVSIYTNIEQYNTSYCACTVVTKQVPICVDKPVVGLYCTNCATQPVKVSVCPFLKKCSTMTVIEKSCSTTTQTEKVCPK